MEKFKLAKKKEEYDKNPKKRQRIKEKSKKTYQKIKERELHKSIKKLRNLNKKWQIYLNIYVKGEEEKKIQCGEKN